MKYKTKPDESGLLRIICITPFGDIKEGNLSQYGNCWIYDNAFE